MATLQQALTRIDAICPNAWDETAKLLWLNECESMIQTRILGAAPEQCITYDADTDRSTALLVPAPFDRLYVYYVIAMCDYAAHETAHYADSMMLFNAALDEYAKWYQRANGAAPIAPGQLQQIAANTKARHTHENLAVLDGITVEKAATWDAKADRTAATASANGLMSKADKAKLDGIAAGATKTIVDAALDAGSANPVQNKVVKTALDTKAGTAVATTSANGLMSAADKAKLDGIAAGATKVTVDSALSDASANPLQNKVIAAALDGKAGTAAATQSADGLMSKADKAKLDGIEAGATKTIVDAALDAGSANPVQNKVVKTALDTKAGTAAATQSANGLMSKADKAKLDGIAAGATKVIVDSVVSASSVNPVQNKAIKQYVDSRAAGSGAVRYDATQTLTFEQKLQARKNIGAVSSVVPTTTGTVSMCPENITDSNDAVHVTATKANSEDFTVTLGCGPEDALVRVAGIRTPTDAQTNYAANVAYVKAKIAALPSVTAADNGKILRVVGGAWAAASLPVYNGGVS